jgi:hypothetical protein
MESSQDGDMQQRSYVGIDEVLLEDVRRVAAEQGRDEREVIEEAVRRYVDPPSASLAESLRRERDQERDRAFAELLERMSGRFDLDEDAAMDLATSEIRAMREERRRATAPEREGEQQ